MALVVTAVVLPLVVVLLVLTRVLGGGDAGDRTGDAVADGEGTGAPERAALPLLPVEVPPVTPEADANCPALMGALPLELAGTRTSTGTVRSTVVHTTVSGSLVSTNHSTPLTWRVAAPTTNPAGGTAPQISTTAGSPQA